MRLVSKDIVTPVLIAALAFGPLSAAPARASAPLRALEYAVSERVDGHRVAGTVAVAITSINDDRGFAVNVREAIGDEETAVEANVDRHGAITMRRGDRVTREEQAVLYFLALGSENLTGMDKGDEWRADGAVPEGRQETHYTVLRSLSNGRIDLGITRAIWMNNGDTSSWRGRVFYD